MQDEGVATETLGAGSVDALGVLSPETTGLPAKLWGGAQPAEIARLLAERGTNLPAAQSLLITLLLAEAEPPIGQPPGESLFLMRVDTLLEMGALDQARALLDTAGAERSPEIFRRYFDVALLIGDEDRACEALARAPGLAPALSTRIFCLARAGDFAAAELTLDTARALGNVSPEEAALLARFMNPDLDGGPAPILPDPVTPLVYRIYQAIGEPLPDTTLPVAFAHADLAEGSGWKAQLDAAERLVRLGVVAPNLLLGLYTQQKPAASGGVWDRAAAVQALEEALSLHDPRLVARALPPAWSLMQDAELEVPFSTIYAPDIADIALTGEAAAAQRQILLLSPESGRLTKGLTSADPSGAFLLALAQGQLQGVTPTDQTAGAVSAAFLTPEVPAQIKALLDEGQVGEALLAALPLIRLGASGDDHALAEGLSILRTAGQDEAARRIGLQVLLLDRRG
jgi:tetratricopeptide (TPR) repeat protein